MKALVLKELKSIFCSSAGAFFALIFLLVSGLILWAFSGSYNFIDSGYADMGNFFWLASLLFMILVPALTMRLFAEEKRNKTFYILLSRPVSISQIYLSKFLATFIFILTTLLPTIIYVFSLSELAYPTGNIDMGSIVASYVSLILLIAVFISIGLFGSAVTKNQIVAFIISLFILLFAFYGFDLLTEFFSSGKTSVFFSSLGLSYHYKLMQRGVIQLNDIFVIVNYLLLFFTLALISLKQNRRMACVCFIMIAILNLLFTFIPNTRFDFTSDKRYTLSEQTIKILKSIGKENNIEIDLFLNGELNQGFQRLQNSVRYLLSDYNKYANNVIIIKNINPYQSEKDATVTYNEMTQKAMPGIVLNETDREGKISRKVIYPYLRITNGVDSLIIPLLKNIAGNTAEENLNASIENLEFEFTDAINLLTQKQGKSIAFIEGHDELNRVYVYDAEELLSKYYSVNRGEIGNEVGILDDFEAIIIAGPIKKYTETEKYIIDQYIMSGGKVLWLIDGVYYSHHELTTTGRSASIKNDVNLDDMLFTYGVRINADLIQDRQCVSTYLITDGNTQAAVVQPDYYQPLLMPSYNHPVTANIKDVKSGFVSSIDVINHDSGIEKNILLTSSANSHLVKVPEIIDFDIERIQDIPGYFNEPFVPVAISLEGSFNSVYTNRMMPDSILADGYKTIIQVKNTKMIVVSSSRIIANEIEGQGDSTQILPMGYDRVSQTQYGNRDFIVNAVNWLTDNDGLMALKNKKRQMYLLDRKAAYENRNKYAALNIGFPLLFMLLIMGSVLLYRKRKYKK